MRARTHTHSPLLTLLVSVRRHLVEPLVQRQPEAEAGQRDVARADGEDPDPRVQRGEHLPVRVGGRDLLQHHRLPQVLHALLTSRRANAYFPPARPSPAPTSPLPSLPLPPFTAATLQNLFAPAGGPTTPIAGLSCCCSRNAFLLHALSVATANTRKTFTSKCLLCVLRISALNMCLI